MARYAITILAIAAIILAAAGSTGAAPPEEPKELTVLAYNTHLFEDSIFECACRCGEKANPPACNWADYNYEDELRRNKIRGRVEVSGADIVVLQEVWAPCWQDWFIEALDYQYSYSTKWDSYCDCYDGLHWSLIGCLYPPGNMIDECCYHYGWHPQTLGNGLVLLSKWPLSDIGFERFPTFEQCGIGGCDAWADKGVLTADVDVNGVTIRIGVSHALGGLHDRSRWDRNFIASTITPFQLKGEAYIFALDSDETPHTAHIVRMEDYGRWWDEKGKKYNSGGGWKHIYGKLCDSDYDVVTSFELDGHPYLFGIHDTNMADIHRINDDPYTGWTTIYKGSVSSDYVAVASFEMDGHPYLFRLSNANHAYIYRINDDPCTGWTTIYEGSMSSDYAAVAAFELDAHPYLFVLNDADMAYIHRINDDPCTGWTTIYAGSMSSEHLNVTSFELDGHPYLFGIHTNNNAYIYRINDDPCTGWTYVYGDPNDEYLKAWYRFEGNTNDSSGNGHHGDPKGGTPGLSYSTDSRGEAYSIKLDGENDYVDVVNGVGISGDSPRTIAGWVKATKPAAEMPGWRGVFGFTSTEGTNTHFDIQRRSGQDYYCIHVNGWEENVAPLDMEWHHLAATYDGYKIAWYSDGSRVGSAARVLNTNDHVHIGRREDRINEYFPGLVDDVRIYSRALSQGEIAQLARSSIAVFEINDHPYLFLQGNCCEQYINCTRCRQGEAYLKRPGEAYLKRINDDPCTGWEDLYQLEDIRIIRDRTVVDEDGPPAIMMGDFNIQADKNGIMDRLFGKAGAVDAYIEVHGSDAGGETGDFLNNMLAQLLCYDNPATPGDECDPYDPIAYPMGHKERVDYVYVRQSGDGVRLVPTEAHVFRDWKYSDGEDDMDLSDHYPLFVKFEIFEGGCTARMKGDLNCDRLINFADLAILSSAWMSGPGDGVWDPACDISEPPDDIIDMKDIDAFARAWLTMPPVHNVTQNTCYKFIQTAIDDAKDGDEIEVAPGTYNEAINFKRKAVRLYSSGGPDVTTIDANGAYHVVKCVNGEDANTILEGFTITGGNANGPTTADTHGGGMYNYNSSPTVTDCNFSSNSAKYGGGMYNEQSSPTLTNCTFFDNWADIGGGMRNWENSSPTLTNCTFSENSARAVGGMSNHGDCNPCLTDCNFTGNSASEDAGGMYNHTDCNAILTNCTFFDNSAVNTSGGMHNAYSSPTLTNCTFNNNSAGQEGGAMLNRGVSSPTVTDCSFIGNSAGSDGGGMYNEQSSPTVTNCTFSGNSSGSYGGGMCNEQSSPMVTECNFSSNFATTGIGGGMHNRDGSDPTVTDCNFTGNSASQAGGIFNDSSSPAVTNCTFSSNSATGIGGGMYNFNHSSPTVTNCTFSGNSADTDGGGMDNRVSSNPNVTNCTFSNNSASGNGGGMDNYDSSPIVKNCILWGNTAQTGSQIDGDSPTVTYSDVQGGTGQSWFGNGCIDADPCFVDVDANDLRLLSDSPCIDAGDNSAVPSGITTDLDGNQRFVDDPVTVDTGSGTPPIVDMGAYEYFIPIPPPPQSSGAVDFEYMAILCANWLEGTEPEL